MKLWLTPALARRILALERREGLSFERLVRYWVIDGMERAEQFWDN
jgi:hypothetical protein